MLYLGAFLAVVDNSGLSLVSCLKVLGHKSKKKSIPLGSVLVISVKNLTIQTFFFKKKERRVDKYAKGTLHRSYLVRTRKQFMRDFGVFLNFNQNGSILINKKNVPLARRVKGPIPIELCLRIPSLGLISQFLL